MILALLSRRAVAPRWFLLWAVCLAAASPAWTQTATKTTAEDANTPRFYRVDDKLYRGAQPLLPDGIRALQQRGIKTIINLRGRDEHTDAEEKLARELGMKYYSHPLPGLSAPKDADVQAILDEIRRADGPVFVHCHHGEDRTGLIVACYRIDGGWTNQQAYDEAKHYKISRLQWGMRRYIKNYTSPKH